MVHGGTLVIVGTTGSGKTFVGQRILQEMLDYYPRGAIRLFIVEDSLSESGTEALKIGTFSPPKVGRNFIIWLKKDRTASSSLRRWTIEAKGLLLGAVLAHY
jgi:hypothetical protein